MFRLISRLRDFLFPADRLSKADFAWDRNVLRTFGIILVALLLVVFAPVVVVIPLMILKELLQPLLASLAGDKLLLMSALETITYVVGFGAAVWFLKSRFSPGTSLSKLTAMNLDSVKGRWWRLLGTAVLFLTVGNLITALVYNLFSISEPYSPAGEFGKQLSGFSFLIFAFCTVVLAPIFEELVFRGFFFNMLRSAFKGGWGADLSAALVSGAIFGAVHMTATGFPALFIMGTMLALVYRRTGSLYGSMTMHMLNNLMATIALYMSTMH